MKYASVCSGVEAASLAWMPLGWEAAWFSEIEPFPCAVLAARFPNVPNLGDMTKIKVENLPNGDQKFTNETGANVIVPGGVDLLVGGTPCQGFSVAGRQKGLKDDRSALCLAYVGLLETMRPRWFVWENVPGVFTTGGGDFPAFIKKIDAIRYSVAWRVLDAQYARVDGYPRAIPQRRRRVFVIGHSSADWRYPASVLFEPNILFRNSPPRCVKGKGFAGSPEDCIGTASAFFRSSNPGQFKRDQVSGTLKENCQSSGNSSTTLVLDKSDALGFTQNDYGRDLCDGFAPTLRRGGESNADGGAIVPAVCYSIGNGQADSAKNMQNEISHTLHCMHDPAAVLCYENHGQDCRIKELKDGVSPQINAKAGTGGNNLPLVLALAENTINRQAHTGGNGTGAQEELAYTQNATGVMGVSVNATVRRLLPVECERLMGFPDNWTRLVAKIWSHEPTSKKFKKFPDLFQRNDDGTYTEFCGDGVRYKACGNSMCVNVMRWIGMRIEITDRKTEAENDRP